MRVFALSAVRDFLRRAFTENLLLKVLALAIALVIFATVRGGREATARISVDVEVLRPDDDADRVLMTDVPESVKLRVRGSYRLVQMLNEDEVPPVTLDLRSTSDGTFALDRASYRIPPGLELVSVAPSSLDLRYEDRITREVPVVPVLTGEVTEGHHVKDPVPVAPESMTVSGPRSGVSQITEARTAGVMVGGLGPGQHRRRVRLEPLPDHCRYVGEDVATVTVTVEPELSERSFAGIGVEVRGSALPATAEPVSVTLRGTPAALAAVSGESIRAFVVLGAGESSPGTYRAAVQLEGIDRALEATAEPSTVIVEVGRAAPPQPRPEEEPEAAAPTP